MEEIPMNDLLEPITSVIRIGLLEFYPLGTKLSIYKHRLYIQQPGFIQAALRWGYGDTRHDLYQLFLAIQLFDRLPYPFSQEQKVQLLEQAKKGFTKLKETYQMNSNHNLVVDSLQYYISQITNIIDKLKKSKKENYVPPKPSAASKPEEQEVAANAQAILNSGDYFPRLMEKLQQDVCVFWTESDFQLILHFLRVCHEKESASPEVYEYLNSLEVILSMKDHNFTKYLQ